MGWFLGLDSSTQSMSAIIVDSETGRVQAESSLNFGKDLPEYNCPQGFLQNADPLVKQADPLMWADALDRVLAKLVADGVDLARVQGVSGSGQQHGTVYLNRMALDAAAWERGGNLVERIKPMLSRPGAPIWMDSSTTAECAEITAAVAGASVQARTGSPAIERFSGPQIRKFFKDCPAQYADTAVIHLVSSFLASVLAGESVGIDYGDGAGMNLLNLADGTWDADMAAATADGLLKRLPEAVPSCRQVGSIADYFVQKYGFVAGTPVIAWSGDNPNSLIGVGGWAPGTAVISLGTSDTYFAAMSKPCVDPAGYGHVFGNPAGGFMSLICFKNGSLARENVKDAFGLDWQQFDVETFANAPVGNNGNMMLPYFVPEITPLVLEAGARYTGSDDFVARKDAAAAVRAVVEAQAMGLRVHSTWIGEKPTTLRVTGGGSASPGICQVLADVFDAKVERLEVGNSAALGAAMRAANAAGNLGWAELTAMFSKTDPARSVSPIPENVPVYEKLLPEFKAFIAREIR